MCGAEGRNFEKGNLRAARERALSPRLNLSSREQKTELARRVVVDIRIRGAAAPSLSLSPRG